MWFRPIANSFRTAVLLLGLQTMHVEPAERSAGAERPIFNPAWRELVWTKPSEERRRGDPRKPGAVPFPWGPIRASEGYLSFLGLALPLRGRCEGLG